MGVVRKINHIVIIQSLPAGDIMTGKQLYDDVVERHIDLLQDSSIKMTHQFFDVKDRDRFISSIKYIEANAPYIPGGILIHFEIHGNKDEGGLVLADHSLIPWKELVELLRPINIATCNKLFITMATCYGRFLYLGVDPNLKSPYQAYISASQEVKTEEIIDKFSFLFESLIECGDLISAYLKLENTVSNFFYHDSETTFEETIKGTYSRLKSDPEYRKEALGPYINEKLENGELPKDIHDAMIERAFREIYVKQKAAFNFSDCP